MGGFALVGLVATLVGPSEPAASSGHSHGGKLKVALDGGSGLRETGLLQARVHSVRRSRVRLALSYSACGRQQVTPAADVVKRRVGRSALIGLRVHSEVLGALQDCDVSFTLKAKTVRSGSRGKPAGTATLLVRCASCNTAPASDRPSPFAGRVGMGAHLLRDRDPDFAAQLQRLSKGGIDWIREDFSWLQIEPERGRFDWRASDQFMSATAAAGISVLAIADYSAPWASSDPSGSGEQAFPPRDPADYANYVSALASRYGRQGTFWRERPTLPYLPLAAIELWNEPNQASFWKPLPDPESYAALVEVAAPAIHAVDPAMKVLACGDLNQVRGATADLWTEWLNPLLDANPSLPQLIDAWSIHPYPSPWNLGPYDESWRPDLSFDRVVTIENILRARNAQRPLWLTEVGWTTAGVDGTVSEQTQALYLGQAIERSLGEWGSFVSKVFVFSWDRASPVDTSLGSAKDLSYGLRNTDDSTRPAWEVIKGLLSG